MMVTTPAGIIDMGTLKADGGSARYDVAATSVVFRARGTEHFLDINGLSTDLNTSTTYTITGDLTVSVFNTNGTTRWNTSKSYWYLDVSGSGVTITPTP